MVFSFGGIIPRRAGFCSTGVGVGFAGDAHNATIAHRSTSFGNTACGILDLQLRSHISDDELHRLLLSILTEGEAAYAVTLLEACPDLGAPSKHDAIYAKFSHKALIYEDFNVHVPCFQAVENTVELADIEFRRKSRFPSGYISRSRQLVSKIKRVLDSHYPRHALKYEKGVQYHYLPKRPSGDLRSTWEDWGSECALYDEPNSSGSAPRESTRIRNDFVIVRFKRFKRPWIMKNGYAYFV